MRHSLRDAALWRKSTIKVWVGWSHLVLALKCGHSLLHLNAHVTLLLKLALQEMQLLLR